MFLKKIKEHKTALSYQIFLANSLKCSHGLYCLVTILGWFGIEGWKIALGETVRIGSKINEYPTD